MSPLGRARDRRGGTEVWAGSCRLCSPEPGEAAEAAVLGLRKAAGSLPSEEAARGTCRPADNQRLLPVKIQTQEGSVHEAQNKDFNSQPLNNFFFFFLVPLVSCCVTATCWMEGESEENRGGVCFEHIIR